MIRHNLLVHDVLCDKNHMQTVINIIVSLLLFDDDSRHVRIHLRVHVYL